MKLIYPIYWFLRFGIRNSFALRRCLDFGGYPLGWRRALAMTWIAARRWTSIRYGSE